MHLCQVSKLIKFLFGWGMMTHNISLEQIITVQNGKLSVPDFPTIPVIPGDGIGPEIWHATEKVINYALEKAFQGKKTIRWKIVAAGEKAFQETGSWLPDSTLSDFRKYIIGLKGPLTTPVGGGIRSLNVALRKDLDLYVCLRPVRWFSGIPAPVLHPENVDMTIFRENTEDVYSGIEFAAGSSQAQTLIDLLAQHFPQEKQKIRFTEDVGLAIKPISRPGCQRLVKAAINYALLHGNKVITLVHKGNIMKFTEGAFLQWGYEIAEREFASHVYTARQWQTSKKSYGETFANQEKENALKEGKIWINDIITDAAFQQVLLYPQDFEILVTTNLNGDYLSDALAAQVGGIGIAPGANINYESGIAIFEATHGTAPTIAGKNMANPSSLMLSADMMLRYMGWNAAAELLISGLERTIAEKKLTSDLSDFVEHVTNVGTQEFADAMCENMSN
jgi:isocitrate dehydrogenase